VQHDADGARDGWRPTEQIAHNVQQGAAQIASLRRICRPERPGANIFNQQGRITANISIGPGQYLTGLLIRLMAFPPADPDHQNQQWRAVGQWPQATRMR